MQVYPELLPIDGLRVRETERLRANGASADATVVKWHAAEVAPLDKLGVIGSDKLSTKGLEALTFVLSTDDVDRHGDVVASDGWRLEAYLRNPVLLWAHDYRHPAIGRALSVWTEPPPPAGEDGVRAQRLRPGGRLALRHGIPVGRVGRLPPHPLGGAARRPHRGVPGPALPGAGAAERSAPCPCRPTGRRCGGRRGETPSPQPSPGGRGGAPQRDWESPGARLPWARCSRRWRGRLNCDSFD